MTSFAVLPGMPATGPYPKQVTRDGLGTHSEGFVVAFSPPEKQSWVGNFQLGLTQYSAAVRHPDEQRVLVIAGGQAYLVDPRTANLDESFGGGIERHWVLEDGQLVLLVHSGVEFEAIGAAGPRWRTARLSWDGFRHLEINGASLAGEAWCAPEQSWFRFEVDLRTGESRGGGFE